MAEGSPSEIELARDRLEALARTWAQKYGVETTARLFGGALLGLVMGTAGRPAAIQFLEDLADQVRQDHPENYPAEPA